MLLVDTVQGKVINDDELKESYAGKQPYGEWLDSNLVQLKDLKIPNKRVQEYTKKNAVGFKKHSVTATKSIVRLSGIWH